MKAHELKGQTIAFAGSGGLDSCTITRWLTDLGVKVVSMTLDLGQPDDPDLGAVKERMLAAGAAEALVLDGRELLAEEGLQVIQAQALYEGDYWNTTGLARHVTTRILLNEMRKRGIKLLSHGATGRGNDQVRFQIVTNMLEPDYAVYAPWRDDTFLAAFGGRKEMIDYCTERGVPVKASHSKPYSTDANMLGLTHEAGKLESLEVGALAIEPEFGVLPTQAPDKIESVAIQFEMGRPVAINGKKISVREAIQVANEIGGRNGVGIALHLVENRFVGIKSRGIYETPGMHVLGRAYEYLLQLILDRRSRRIFNQLSEMLAEQIYQGYWYDTASEAAKGAVGSFARFATGTIKLDLYKGHTLFGGATGVTHCLYSETAASMEKVGEFNHADSEGFLNVLGVSAKILARSGQVSPD
ncbi:MAG: argininosuccinate synthase [Candidatus Sumerlaeaceae bacterium]|nr:argininosuccinate synthase [Candidatus Sumerlaeaceae bacterium]